MFTWKNNYLWDFSDEGRSDPDKGPAITGSKMFRGGQYKNVVRETVQNGSDAKDPSLPADTPVKMCFEYIMIERQDVPGIERLSAVIDKCYSYMKSKPNVKMDDIEILEAANKKYLKNGESIPALKISDYNTKGLTRIDYLCLTSIRHNAYLYFWDVRLHSAHTSLQDRLREMRRVHNPCGYCQTSYRPPKRPN